MLCCQLSLAQESFINGLYLGNGCRIIEAPKSKRYNPKKHEDISNYTPEALLDQRQNTLWSSSEDSKYPYVFVFELADEFQVQSLYFNNKSEEYEEGASAKRVKVEFSTTSAEDGFEEVLDIKLNANESNSIRFDDHKVRWVKLIILSNHGHKELVQLRSFQAMGSYTKVYSDNRNVEGTWQSNWGWVSLIRVQNNKYVGCYEFEDGEIVEGNIKHGRKLDFVWEEKSISNKGWAQLAICQGETRICGLWGKDNWKSNGKPIFGIWDFVKTSNIPKSCAIEVEKDSITTDTVINEPPLKSQFFLDLQLRDKDSDEPIAGATVALLSSDGNTSYTETTDNEGKIKLTIDENEYSLTIQKEGFLKVSEKLNYIKINPTESNQLPIWKARYTMNSLKVGDSFQLENIEFQRGKYTLLEESYPELNHLVDLLNEHPNMKIRVEGHTDNQGSSRLNKILSEQRVESVRDYLIEKGIKPKRIDGIGYGGTRPIADNRDPELRRKNRRVEIVILEL